MASIALALCYATKVCRCSLYKEQATPQVVFQNADCQRRFGLPRSISACYDVVMSMSDDHRQALRNWELDITRVHVYT